MPPPPSPEPPEDDESGTAVGRFLRWLAPPGEHDDWLEPDLDPDGENESGPGDGLLKFRNSD